MAATRGKLAADARVPYIEREPGRLQQQLQALDISTESIGSRLLTAVVPILMLPDPVHSLLPGAPQAVVDGMKHDRRWLAGVSEQPKPFDAVLHCLCSTP